MENKHIPVMIEEIKSYIPLNKELNIIDGFLVGGSSLDSKKFIDIVKKTFN